MTAHDWYIENRAGFVARSLERGEERTFRDHLVRCDECTREVARMERDLGWLPMGVAPVARPGLRPADGGRDPRSAEPVAALPAAGSGGRLALCRWAASIGDTTRGSRAARAPRVAREPAGGARGYVVGLRRANMVLQTQISMNGTNRAAC